MPTSWPSATSSSFVNPSPMSRSPAWSSAARRMIRSSASRLISSPGMLALDPRLVEGGGQGLAGDLFGEGGAGCGRGLRRLLEESFEQFDREREDRGRIVLGSDLGDGLQEPQLDRRGLGADDVRGLSQLLGRLQLAFGVDDLRPPLALRLGL